MTLNLDPLSTAYAWAAVRLAASNDTNRAALYRTIEIGHYPDGELYTATDSYTLLQAWVPSIDEPYAPQPGIDEAPMSSVAVCDPDNRALDLIRYIRGHKPEEIEPGTFLRYKQRRQGENSAQQPLTPEMSGNELVLDYAAGQETVAIPVNEHEYVDWRGLVSSLGDRGPVSAIAYSDVILSTVSKLAKMLGCSVRFDFGANSLSAARIVMLEPSVDERVSFELSGFVMPVHTVESAVSEAS